MALTISPLASCQPFLVVYTGVQDHCCALGLDMVANQLDQGVANASLSSNIQDIRENAKLLRMPRDLHQVSLLLQQFAVLLTHALFQGPGTPNPFVRCLWLLSCAFHERLLFGAAPSAHGHTIGQRYYTPHTCSDTCRSPCTSICRCCSWAGAVVPLRCRHQSCQISTNCCETCNGAHSTCRRRGCHFRPQRRSNRHQGVQLCTVQSLYSTRQGLSKLIAESIQLAGGGMTFNKEVYQCYQQC